GRNYPSYGRPQDCVGGMLSSGYANRSARLVAQFAELREVRVDLVEAGTNGAKEPFARLSRRDATRCARQQANAEALFEAPHGVTQRRCRDPKLRRCVCEAPLAGHGDEGREVVEVLARHC